MQEIFTIQFAFPRFVQNYLQNSPKYLALSLTLHIYRVSINDQGGQHEQSREGKRKRKGGSPEDKLNRITIAKGYVSPKHTQRRYNINLLGETVQTG